MADGDNTTGADQQLAGGVIELLLLQLLSDDERYVYDLTGALVEHGLDDLRETTVYTAVKRMEKRGLLISRRETSEGGRPRRYYRATDDGVAELERRRNRWRDLSMAVEKVLGVDL